MTLSRLPVMPALFAAFTLHAQSPAGDGFTCLANHPEELARHLVATPGAAEAAEAARLELEARTLAFEAEGQRGGPYVIPVVFHIIHNNGPENISDEQIIDAVRILNQDYNKQNPDWTTVRPEFLDIVADVGIEFRLATKDPQGNCTNGITRTMSTRTYDGDFEMTQLIQWPRNRYMNVWVAASADGAAGYTYYPQWLNNWPEADGIVVMHTYVGSIGTSSPGTSRVLSHEVGHWLNLAHCWGSTNEPGVASNCNSDDGVADTPNTVGWTTCLLSGASCGSPLDNVQNYMEYSYCSKMFTNGQAARMIAALTSNVAQRENLWQPANLLQTGVSEEPELCLARFGHTLTEICTGGMITFTDQSYHGVTSRTWSFPGGTPSTSTLPNPTVTYETPGTYPVTLTVSDGVNQLSVTEETLVHVMPAPGHPVPFTEGFEGLSTLGDNDWTVSNPDQDHGFMLTNSAAYSGATSVMLTNTASSSGRKDMLTSHTFDMTDATDITVSFRYAFAQRNPGNDDRLRFYVSNNCGASWSLRKQLRAGIDLATAGPTGGSFVPSGPEQWGLATVSNITPSSHTGQFRIRFEFESNGGNNVYIDDININGQPVGIDDLVIGSSYLLVLPNPARDRIELRYTHAGGPITAEVLDITGRIVVEGPRMTPGVGVQRIQLPVDQLPGGVYFVRLHTIQGAPTARFVVEH
jgi:PKD repeat protein